MLAIVGQERKALEVPYLTTVRYYVRVYVRGDLRGDLRGLKAPTG